MWAGPIASHEHSGTNRPAWLAGLAALVSGVCVHLVFVPASASARRLVDCSSLEFRTDEEAVVLTAKAVRFERAVFGWRDPGKYPLEECRQGLWLLSAAYCRRPSSPGLATRLKGLRAACRDWEFRAQLAETYRRSKRPLPREAYGPGQLETLAARAVALARKVRTDPKQAGAVLKQLRGMSELLAGNRRFERAFDRLFASYYGTSVWEAGRLRKRRLFEGRLAGWPRDRVLRLSLSVLLGYRARTTGELSVSYLDLLYLYRHVYEPLLSQRTTEPFPRALCAVRLRRRRMRFDARSVSAAMAAGACGRPEEASLVDVLREPRLRAVLAALIARRLRMSSQGAGGLAGRVALQVGGRFLPVCWQLPVPDGRHFGARVVSGPRCLPARGRETDSFGRPVVFAPVQERRPLSQWTRLELLEALEILREAPSRDPDLEQRLRSAMRNAPSEVCQAYRVLLGRGRRGLFVVSVQSSRLVPCGKVRRSRWFARRLSREPRWDNDFDTVFGGEFLGPWRRAPGRGGRGASKGGNGRVRPAVVYVKQKV